MQVWPTKQDDFFPYASDPHAYWTGYHSSRPSSKLMIRQTEWMSNVLSKIAASELVDDDVEEQLDELRRTVGVVQHHDAATGTERQAVADDYSRRMNRALQEGAEALNISASFVPPFLNKSKASFARFKSFMRKGISLILEEKAYSQDETSSNNTN